MRALVITRKEIKIVSTSGNYEDLKKLIGIESPITVVERKIGDKYYDLWVDDEGLLKNDNHIQAWHWDGPMPECLVGNIVVLSSNEKGESIGLSNSDIINVLDRVITYNRGRECNNTLLYCDNTYTFEKGDLILVYTF